MWADLTIMPIFKNISCKVSRVKTKKYVLAMAICDYMKKWTENGLNYTVGKNFDTFYFELLIKSVLVLSFHEFVLKILII